MADQENWKKVKGVWKRTKDLASKGALGTDKFRYLKKKKKKDYVTDPDATFGGKRIRIKDGPEIKVSNAQEDLSKIKRMGRPDTYGGTGKMNPSFRKKITGMGKPNPEKPLSVKELKASGKYKKYSKGGRAALQGGGRTNLLEELGRVEGESPNRNRRAEVSRIHGELNKGYSLGGRVGAAKRGFNKKILRKD